MSFRVKIINKTDWPTGEFRKLFRACAKHEGMDHDGVYIVELYYPRGGGGWGYFNRRHMMIALPNWDCRRVEDRQRATKVSAVTIARVIIHEMGHNRGLRHKDMDFTAEGESAIEVCEALGMTMLYRDTPTQRAKAACPGPSKLEVAQGKVDRVDELIAAEEKRHATNIKRLRTRRRKAVASLRYYESKDGMNGLHD